MHKYYVYSPFTYVNCSKQTTPKLPPMTIVAPLCSTFLHFLGLQNSMGGGLTGNKTEKKAIGNPCYHIPPNTKH